MTKQENNWSYDEKKEEQLRSKIIKEALARNKERRKEIWEHDVEPLD